MEEENKQWIFPEEDKCEVACVILRQGGITGGDFLVCHVYLHNGAIFIRVAWIRWISRTFVSISPPPLNFPH